MTSIADLFSADGVLAQALDGYQPRSGQIEMAQQVETMLLNGGQAVLEAGTGIGKTFAYLTPIIQSGMTAVISTGARALQDQLSQRDIPQLAQALGRDVSLAVLKGRANYICRLELETPGGSGELFGEQKGEWQEIIAFAARSEDGDIRGISGVSSNSPLLAQAVSTQESCKKHSCAYYKDNACFLYNARQRAMEADIVIVNHHLFLSDMRLRDEGVAELLPSRDAVLFDEAHLLPQLAPQFFGERTSSAVINRLTSDIIRCVEKGVPQPAQAARSAAQTVRSKLDALLEVDGDNSAGARHTAAALLADSDWTAAALQLHEALAALARLLQDYAGQVEEYATYASRTMKETKILGAWLAAADDKDTKDTTENNEAADDSNSEEQMPDVRWAEYGKNNNLILHSVPMSGRVLLRKQWQQLPAVMFTSATLSVGDDFSDFCEETGLDTDHTYRWDSPYNFAERSLLYLPQNLPAPNDAQAHTEAVVNEALPLVRANNGRAFVLFSSWRALNQASTLLYAGLEQDNIKLLKQGDMPNDELLRRFRDEKRAVLIGSQSFWQGVDVRGDALSLLVVDKIPFTPPTDPLLMARDEWRKKHGENAFMRNQLPAAVLLMKQVAGRLIRDYDDYGVFMIGDPRILNKGYGRTVLNAMPPMPQCRDAAAAVTFLQQFGSTDAATTSDTINA